MVGSEAMGDVMRWHFFATASLRDFDIERALMCRYVNERPARVNLWSPESWQVFLETYSIKGSGVS